MSALHSVVRGTGFADHLDDVVDHFLALKFTHCPGKGEVPDLIVEDFFDG